MATNIDLYRIIGMILYKLHYNEQVFPAQELPPLSSSLNRTRRPESAVPGPDPKKYIMANNAAIPKITTIGVFMFI